MPDPNDGSRARATGPADRRGGLLGQVVGLVDPGDGVGSDSVSGRSGIGGQPRLDLGQELEDPRPALGGVIEMDMQVRDPLDAQPLARARGG